MKHLKTYNESIRLYTNKVYIVPTAGDNVFLSIGKMQNEIFDENVIDDIKYILLDLEDDGFEVEFDINDEMKIQEEIFIVRDSKFIWGDVKNTVERLDNYLRKLGIIIRIFINDFEIDITGKLVS